MIATSRTDWTLVLLLWGGAGLGSAAQYGKVGRFTGFVRDLCQDQPATLDDIVAGSLCKRPKLWSEPYATAIPLGNNQPF